MKKNKLRKLGLIYIILIIALTGCTSSGIHIYSPVWLMGEVRESSPLHQPVPNVSILSAAGDLLGQTDNSGQFRVQVTPQDGMVQITLDSPYYRAQTIQRKIAGSSTLTIQLDVLYLKDEGTGEVQGRIERKSSQVQVQSQFIPVQLPSSPLFDHVVAGEYNLATSQSKEWLLDKLQGRGKIIQESAGGFYSLQLDPEYSEEVMQELKTSNDVEYILPNSRVELLGMGSDEELWSDLWNLQMLDMESAWQYSTGEGVVVAVLDTLYNTTHPDLTANLMEPLDVEGRTETDLYLSSHGLHVAGTIGAVANGQGILGVAPNVSILPIRIFDAEGYATISSLVKGIDLAIAHGAQVINLSVGTHQARQDLHDAVQRAYDAGIVLVGAAGNSGESQLLYPAAYHQVIAVGAVAKDGERTAYSHFGSGMEIMAPGGDSQDTVLSTGIYGDYRGLYGTSMATPHVSGLVAQLIAYGVTDPDTIRSILRDTAKDLGETGYDLYTGYGLIQPVAALNYLRKTYVFFGDLHLETGVAEMHSPIYQAQVGGQYQIANILPGQGRVVAWVDVNDNQVIDAGDYVGKSAIMTIVDGSQLSQDVEIERLGDQVNTLSLSEHF